jgi:hypothetical protein
MSSFSDSWDLLRCHSFSSFRLLRSLKAWFCISCLVISHESVWRLHFPLRVLPTGSGRKQVDRIDEGRHCQENSGLSQYS